MLSEEVQVTGIFASKFLGTITLVIFFLVFPDGCTQYDGPNSLDCYNTIWQEIGCEGLGEDFPSKQPLRIVNAFKKLSLT